MTSRWKHLLMAALLSLGFLVGCNTDNNQQQDENENNEPNQEENSNRPDENDNETHKDDLYRIGCPPLFLLQYQDHLCAYHYHLLQVVYYFFLGSVYLFIFCFVADTCVLCFVYHYIM